LDFDMTTTNTGWTQAAVETSSANFWHCYLLEHLEEFASMAWYLLADGDLVEELFLRAIVLLDAIRFKGQGPFASQQVRTIIASEAVAMIVEARRRQRAENWNAELFPLRGLPDLPHLLFVLRFILRCPEAEVASLLGVDLDAIQNLVSTSIQSIGGFQLYAGETRFGYGVFPTIVSRS
jgi:DNA-directed RNA polymerase specialized sigma24 family protein